MIIDIDRFDILRFAKVDRIVPGIGSFLNLYFKRAGSNEELQIWIYLCEWAITKDGIEVISSDAGENISRFDFTDIFSDEISFLSLEIVDEDELHLLFSKGVVVEVWANESLYGNKSELISLFKNGQSITTVITD